MRPRGVLRSALELACCVVVVVACERPLESVAGFGVGNWPPASYHPFAANAWINLPLPASPAVDPNSAALVTAFNAHGAPLDKCAGCANDYDHPIYWAKANDPTYTLTGCGYSGALNGNRIHALSGMLPGGGTDGHVAVMDQSTNIEWDFWQATIDDAARTIGGHACGRLSLQGDARIAVSGGSDGDGANAANTALYTGQIRGVELMAGVIQHAIAVDASCTNGTHVYPASGNALGGCASDPADGQFFQLTYSDAQIDALAVAAWKKVVLHAMHQYGFYIDDTGSGAHSFALHFESDKMYQAYGYEDPLVTYAKQHVGQDIYLSGGAYYYQIGTVVDWTRVQVIQACVIQRTC